MQTTIKAEKVAEEHNGPHHTVNLKISKSRFPSIDGRKPMETPDDLYDIVLSAAPDFLQMMG